MKRKDAMQRIILAAIDIINTGGSSAVTIRRVAEAADVNSAALNYYFGSKENLIQQALGIALSNIYSDWELILSSADLDAPEKVFLLFDYMMEGIHRYPGFTRSFLFEPVEDTSVKEQFIKKLDKLLAMLAAELSGESTVPAKSMKISLGRALQSAMLSSMIPEFFTILTGSEIDSSSTRNEFILPLVDSIPGIEFELTPAFLHRVEEFRKEAFRPL